PPTAPTYPLSLHDALPISWALRASSGAPEARRPSPRRSGRLNSPAAATDMPQHFGGGGSPFLIAGPCVVESDDLNLRVGEALADLALKVGLHVIYKASYDKANRSRLKGPRGPGAERGFAALAKVRAATGLPILPDVHETSHVSA